MGSYMRFFVGDKYFLQVQPNLVDSGRFDPFALVKNFLPPRSVPVYNSSSSK